MCRRKATRKLALAVGFTCLAALLALQSPARAGNPHSAVYTSNPSRVFWFIHISDTHIGASGSADTDNLTWLVNAALTVINPSFIVATGDLTDSTNGNLFGYPNGPYQEEWTKYRSIITSALGTDTASLFFDIPGNHDAYSDKNFAYYLNNSIQGKETGKTQLSWTRQFPFGKYHFLGVNSADNTGAAFSLFWPYGDNAGLDATELAFIQSELVANADADLTLVFGHHPLYATGNSQDTYLYYGYQEFVADLDGFAASEYGYGHTHASGQVLFKGNTYTGLMNGDGIRYLNLAALGKDSPNEISIVAVDGNGISTVTQAVETWPIVLITAPVNNAIGTSPNPYAYTVPNSATNPIRALVFDQGSVSQVRFRVDSGATWYPMTTNPTNPKQWLGTWDASAATSGSHTIEVQATGTTVRSDIISVTVTGANSAPVANADSYTTQQGITLTIAAPGVLGNDTDADGDTLTASLSGGPANGTLTLNAGGSFVYTPSSGFFGSDSFVYTASDGKAVSAAATVTITVSASTDTVTITKAAFSNRAKQLTVQAKSSAAPDAVLTAIVDGVNYGTMTYNKKTKVYSFVKAFSTAPASVTVTSSKGGLATSRVRTVK